MFSSIKTSQTSVVSKKTAGAKARNGLVCLVCCLFGLAPVTVRAATSDPEQSAPAVALSAVSNAAESRTEGFEFSGHMVVDQATGRVCRTNHNGLTRERVLEVVTDLAFAPFSFINEKDELEGIDVAIMDAISRKTGMPYRLCAENFIELMNDVSAGKVDGAIAGISYTNDRSKILDYSKSYYRSSVSVVAQDISGINSIDDLKDRTAVVKSGTLGEMLIRNYEKDLRLKVNQYDTSLETMMSVHMGESDFLFEDYPVAVYQIATGLYPGLRVVIERLPGLERNETYHFVTRKDTNQDVINLFNEGLSAIIDDGSYEKIISYYLPSQPEPRALIPEEHIDEQPTQATNTSNR